jgi:phenylpyruvate tautomerase PptA (4-oxalocrotonate tautomerase family)
LAAVPMIDIYAPAGTFADPHALATAAAATVMRVEAVPDIPMFRENTAAFVHEMPADAISDVAGGSDHVRVQVLTNTGALDRDKQIAVVERLTALIAEAAGDPTLARRTWVLLTEATPRGWGLAPERPIQALHTGAHRLRTGPFESRARSAGQSGVTTWARTDPMR